MQRFAEKVQEGDLYTEGAESAEGRREKAGERRCKRTA
jgi:hypothetical protein